MIELQQIHKSFGSHEVIRGIDLRIEKGQTLVLLGLSGSGKTTTLKLINGLHKPDAGRILLDRKPLSSLPLLEVRRNMGYVIQQGGLFPHFSVYDNIAVVPRLLGWEKARIEERVRLLMQKIHLPPENFWDKYPAQLSGGQQQRVGLARALAANPPVLLMDEPFGALDPITRNSVRKEFLELDELNDKTIVLVTHDVQEAFELGDQVALMQSGKIIQHAPPSQILAHPANEFVKEFIRADLLSLSLKSEGLYDSLNESLATGKLTSSDLKNLAHE